MTEAEVAKQTGLDAPSEIRLPPRFQNGIQLDEPKWIAFDPEMDIPDGAQFRYKTASGVREYTLVGGDFVPSAAPKAPPPPTHEVPAGGFVDSSSIPGLSPTSARAKALDQLAGLLNDPNTTAAARLQAEPLWAAALNAAIRDTSTAIKGTAAGQAVLALARAAVDRGPKATQAMIQAYYETHSEGTVTEFGKAVLDGLFPGDVPSTTNQLRLFQAWAGAEGGGGAYNPLNSTEPAPGATNFNSVGVKNYPDFKSGVAATIRTIKNGRYPTLLAALRAGDAQAFIAAKGELGTWSGSKDGGVSYANNIAGLFGQSGDLPDILTGNAGVAFGPAPETFTLHGKRYSYDPATGKARLVEGVDTSQTPLEQAQTAEALARAAKLRQESMPDAMKALQAYVTTTEFIRAQLKSGAWGDGDQALAKANEYQTANQQNFQAALQGTTPFQIAKLREEQVTARAKIGEELINQRLQSGAALANSMLSQATEQVKSGYYESGFNPLGYARDITDLHGGGPEMTGLATSLLKGLTGETPPQGPQPPAVFGKSDLPAAAAVQPPPEQEAVLAGAGPPPAQRGPWDNPQGGY